VQLKNDIDGRNLLDQTIYSYYKKNGERHASLFLYSEDKDWNCIYSHFLIDRKHVIRYGIAQDRVLFVGGVSLAIGPHYFTAADFWSYENLERFTMEATTEGVEKNLALLDEFFGSR
jgi:hypothetical protein